MPYLFLGFGALVGIVFLFKLYTDANVKKIASSMRWTGLLIGLLLLLFLFVRGQSGLGMGGVVATGVWVWRVFGWSQMFRGSGGTFGGSRASGSAPPPSTGMDEAEALRILGLSPGATADDVKMAHRRLMTQMHPDRGGSDYLAAKVNAAKDVLLKRRP